MKICSVCGEKVAAKRQVVCSSCHRRGRRERIRKLYEDFLAQGCKLCGDKRRPVLQAHHAIPRGHRPNGKRYSSLASLTGLSVKHFGEELSKCVPLCANCHLMVEAGEMEVYLADDPWSPSNMCAALDSLKDRSTS